MIFNHIKNKEKQECILEALGHFPGTRFKVDIEWRTPAHGPRVKACQGSGIGTSVPIKTIENGYLPYDSFINDPAVKIERDTKKYLPFVAGFTTVYQKELYNYVNGIDPSIYGYLENEIDKYFKKYIDRHGNVKAGDIRADADIFVFSKNGK